MGNSGRKDRHTGSALKQLPGTARGQLGLPHHFTNFVSKCFLLGLAAHRPRSSPLPCEDLAAVVGRAPSPGSSINPALARGSEALSASRNYSASLQPLTAPTSPLVAVPWVPHRHLSSSWQHQWGFAPSGPFSGPDEVIPPAVPVPPQLPPSQRCQRRRVGTAPAHTHHSRCNVSWWGAGTAWAPCCLHHAARRDHPRPAPPCLFGDNVFFVAPERPPGLDA